MVTFDENHSYTKQNRVFTLLLGGAVPTEAHGTVDTNYYGAKSRPPQFLAPCLRAK